MGDSKLASNLVSSLLLLVAYPPFSSLLLLDFDLIPHVVDATMTVELVLLFPLLCSLSLSNSLYGSRSFTGYAKMMVGRNGEGRWGRVVEERKA